VAAPAGINGAEQADGWCVQGGGDVARAAVSGNHQSAAANDRFGGAEADVFIGEAFDLGVIRGVFDGGCGGAFARAAEDEGREAEFVGGAEGEGNGIFRGPVFGVAEGTASV